MLRKPGYEGLADGSLDSYSDFTPLCPFVNQETFCFFALSPPERHSAFNNISFHHITSAILSVACSVFLTSTLSSVTCSSFITIFLFLARMRRRLKNKFNKLVNNSSNEKKKKKKRRELTDRRFVKHKKDPVCTSCSLLR